MSAPFHRTEAAPVLRTFGDLASRVADLVRARPSLLTGLAFAPASAVHATATWLYTFGDSDLPTSDVAALLDETDPRTLLQEAISGAPAQLYRALGRIGDRVRDRQFYERLAAVAIGPVADVLWGDHAIDVTVLDFAERLLTLDSAVLRLRHLLSRDAHNADRLHSAILLARSYGVLFDDDLVMPPQAGLPALAKRMQTVLDRIAAPSPGFDLAPPLRVIKTLGELREAGRKLENCLADFGGYGGEYPFQFATGAAVFIVSDGEPAYMAKLDAVGPGLFQLESMTGQANQMLPRSATESFHQQLRGAGVVLPPQHVVWSAQWVLNPGRGARRAGLGGALDIEDDGNGPEDDDLAA